MASSQKVVSINNESQREKRRINKKKNFPSPNLAG